MKLVLIVVCAIVLISASRSGRSKRVHVDNGKGESCQSTGIVNVPHIYNWLKASHVMFKLTATDWTFPPPILRFKNLILFIVHYGQRFKLYIVMAWGGRVNIANDSKITFHLVHWKRKQHQTLDKWSRLFQGDAAPRRCSSKAMCP